MFSDILTPKRWWRKLYGVHMTNFPETKTVSTDSLIPYAMNSRTHSDKQVNQIAASIKEFGFLNPVIIDGDNGIIAGHGRVLAAKKLEMLEIPVIEASHLNEAQKKAFVIADNKLAMNAGWDEKRLFSEINSLLDDEYNIAVIGFDESEIAKILGTDSEEIAGEIEFSQEIGESNNYVVLVFRNDLDWLAAQTHFDLKTVYSKRANGKPWSKGVGRVLDGAKYITGQK